MKNSSVHKPKAKPEIRHYSYLYKNVELEALIMSVCFNFQVDFPFSGKKCGKVLFHYIIDILRNVHFSEIPDFSEKWEVYLKIETGENHEHFYPYIWIYVALVNMNNSVLPV